MLTLALTLSLAASPGTPPAPSADAVVAAAFDQGIDTKTQNLKSDAQTSLTPVLVPFLAIVGLAAFAFAARKRRPLGGQGIQVLEAASLGDKRSLVIADVLGERMVLAVSEAGISVLQSKPAPAFEMPVASAVVAPVVQRAAPTPRPSVMGFLARLRGKHPAPSFDADLQESIEDQELRAKLAAGVRGVVP